MDKNELARYLTTASSAELRAVIVNAWDRLTEDQQIELAFMSLVYADMNDLDKPKALDSNCIMFH